jgi:hypothetical protein
MLKLTGDYYAAVEVNKRVMTSFRVTRLIGWQCPTMDRVKINTNIDAANKDGKVACCGSVICGRALGVYE